MASGAAVSAVDHVLDKGTGSRAFALVRPPGHHAEHGRAMAAVIPDARLVLYDGFASVWYSSSPEPPAAQMTVRTMLPPGVSLGRYRG